MEIYDVVESDAKRNQLMSELDEHEMVEAALIVDSSGELEQRVGSSPALTAAAGATEQLVSPEADDSDSPGHSVYVTRLEEDFLLVLFDAEVDFDRLKEEIDGLIARCEIT